MHYVTTDPFASAVYSALRTGVAEAGWEVRDCGTDDVSTAIEEDTRWQAIFTRVPVPQTPAQISRQWGSDGRDNLSVTENTDRRSEEHTSELQSRGHLVCRLLLEKKNKNKR